MLRHFSPLLDRWSGGDARMWELTVSHPTLTLRVTKRTSAGCLDIICIDPLSITGPVRWLDANITVEISDPEGFIVKDRACGLEIKTCSVEAKEHPEAE